MRIEEEEGVGGEFKPGFLLYLSYQHSTKSTGVLRIEGSTPVRVAIADGEDDGSGGYRK